MERTKLTFHQFKSEFFKPLSKKYRFLTVSASLIIGLAFYIGIDIVLADMVHKNSYSIHVLSAELLNELGPDYTIESKRHAEMINKYAEHLDQRKVAAILRILYPTRLSPQKTLASASKALKKAKDKQEAKNAIWQAGVVSNGLYLLSKRVPRSPIAWYKSEDSSDLLEDLNNEFETFHEQVDKLENAQNLEDAFAVSLACRVTCQTSRNIMLILSLAVQLDYDIKKNEEKIERFQSDLERARDLALLFAKTEKFCSERQVFEDRARNKNQRLKILKAMLDNDMDRFHEVLRKWIEFANAWREAKKALETLNADLPL